MQSVSSRIWTRVAVSIYYDDNHYTTGNWYLMLPFLNIQHYTVWIKGKRELSGHLQLRHPFYFYLSFIIIMSCHRHGYPWPSLATSPYRSSPLASLWGYILYLHIAAVCMFELVVLLLPGHMWGSIGVHPLWVHPCSSSSVLHVWFV